MGESIGVEGREDWLANRATALLNMSPYLSIRTLPLASQQHFGIGAARVFGQQSGEQRLPMHGIAGEWQLQHLAWDSAYFGTTTYRLATGLFGTAARPAQLANAAADLRRQLAAEGSFYAFSIVPSEDIQLLQALTAGGWQLVETRLNFYCPVAYATLPPPAAVRLARPEEAEYIGRIAASARNPFDRFHADPWFGNDKADAFLARYAQATVEGTYANAVLLPDEPGLPVDAFLAIGDLPALPAMPGSAASRVLLTAVGPANRGWHYKLVAETVRRAQALSLPLVLMTTQATNGAVFRTCEKLGFRLGNTSHVLACHAT